MGDDNQQLGEYQIDIGNLMAFDPHHQFSSVPDKRPTWEGGQYDGDEQSRLAALRLAMELGAEHIDVELKAIDDFNNLIRRDMPTKCKVIVSSHNYQNTPSVEDLGNLVARIQSTGADIVNFATTAIDITDVARVFQITVHSQVSGRKS